MSESLESLALEAAGNVDDGKAVAGLSELLRALACVCRERDELAAWKESAITVWPPSQEIARAIGVQLGESVHDKILPWIKQANSDRNSLRSELDALRARERACPTMLEAEARALLRAVQTIAGHVGLGIDASPADVCAAVGALSAPQPPREVEPKTWYEGTPPFPQDREWFIAILGNGERVVLRPLDEGHTYDYTTGDGTYYKAKSIKQWMQFPDCEYLPPAQQPPLEVERLTDEAIAAEVERRWDTHSEPLTFGAVARWARDYCNSAWGLKLKEQQ